MWRFGNTQSCRSFAFLNSSLSVFIESNQPTFPSSLPPLLHLQNKNLVIGKDQCIERNLWLSLSSQGNDAKMAGREINQLIS